MSEWHALEFIDDDGNHCFAVQYGHDETTLETIEFIEADIADKPDMIAQAQVYMKDARAEAQMRNEEAAE
jgi:hypothetical protein